MIARILTYTVIAILATFVIFTTFFLDQGGGKAEPHDEGIISVHDLSINPERHRGETVTTEGTLNYSEETTRYQVVDESIAVVVSGYELEALHELSGQPVIVTGRFDFDAEAGIYIDADTIEVKD
jgi:hypothetical protein